MWKFIDIGIEMSAYKLGQHNACPEIHRLRSAALEHVHPLPRRENDE